MIRLPTTWRSMLGVCMIFTSATAIGGVDRSLAYPSGTPSGTEIADQVYFVNHFYAMDNYAITKQGKNATVLINKSAGKKPSTITLTRYLNNQYDDDGSVKAKDLAIFHSGKLRGTGMLITDFAVPAC